MDMCICMYVCMYVCIMKTFNSMNYVGISLINVVGLKIYQPLAIN